MIKFEITGGTQNKNVIEAFLNESINYKLIATGNSDIPSDVVYELTTPNKKSITLTSDNFTANKLDGIANNPADSGTYTLTAYGVFQTEDQFDGRTENTTGEVITTQEINFSYNQISKPEDPIPNTIPFVSKIESINGKQITISDSVNDYIEKVRPVDTFKSPISTFSDIAVGQRVNDKRDLATFLHFGDDNMKLITNTKGDSSTFDGAVVYKLYEPLDTAIQEKENAYVVREILPQLTEEVELIPYEQEEEELTVLRPIESPQKDLPVSLRKTEFQNYNQLITTDTKLQEKIVDKFLSGSDKPVELNVDYSNFENFVNFSSAEKRLKNFKYKLQQIEGYTQQSSSLVGVTGSEKDTQRFDNLIRRTKNNFDGYESYLYNVSSSYVSSSLGQFKDASVPKTGSGTYADPYVPVSSSNSLFTNWYGSVNSKTGQIYSASFYDTSNPNRLVNLLPEHIKDNSENKYFLDFLDMVGQQFDELWLYTKSISDITDRQNDLSEGFSKDLLFNLASSLGWSINDGKDLVDLSRFAFGQKLSGTTYSLYTSGSLDSPVEADISKEITKRLISSMPYILKSKGTLGSLKAIINCYGIPSSILRVKEYGGMETEKKPQFEISRKFTKALGFRAGQYVETSWENDSVTTRKPETVELRFRSVSGSDQVLVQKDTDWAIKLKNNNSNDNKGTVAFILSGSTGQKEISSSLLPVFDGEYYSVMLTKQKVDTNLFPSSSFETPSGQGLFNPPFITGTNSAEGGVLSIVSSSGVSRSGTKSLQFENTRTEDEPAQFAYSYLYRSSSAHPGMEASLANVSQGESYTLDLFAKVSSSQVDSVVEASLVELDTDGAVVNWTNETDYQNVDGGYASSPYIGINENEWKQVTVTKTIKFPNTTRLGIQLYNHKAKTKIFIDDLTLKKNLDNTDSVADAFDYNLFVKKFDAGLDMISLSSTSTLTITGSSVATQSYNAAWTGSGDLFIGGNNTSEFNANKLSGSIMEFRLYSEPLKEKRFDIHVSNPKSYIANSSTGSFSTLIRRLSFDDNKVLPDNESLRDTRPNQTTTQSGSAQGFGNLNTFESVVDRTKTIVPNSGPNRRMATKIRIESNYLSGSGVNLKIDERSDKSSNDYAPLDSPRLGVYFSPTDVINEDIISSFANLDFNQLLGDPRDNFSENYRDLKDTANQYFQKYSGSNNTFDYIRLIKYYDQSIFKQLRKVIPARAKAQMGTLIEGNIFERPKSPVQRNNPTFTQPNYEKEINLSNFEIENEDSRSVLLPSGEFPTHTGEATNRDVFLTPSLYRFATNSNYDEVNRYKSGSVTYGGPNSVFTEATSSVYDNNRLSILNKEYRFFYTSSVDYDKSNKRTTDLTEHFYTSKSLVDTDLDPMYEDILGLNRSIYEGVKNTVDTTIDGESPIIIRTTAPTVAVPFDSGDSNLKVIDDL